MDPSEIETSRDLGAPTTLFPNCHPKSLLLNQLSQGTLHLSCAECQLPVATMTVTDVQPAPPKEEPKEEETDGGGTA